MFKVGDLVKAETFGRNWIGIITEITESDVSIYRFYCSEMSPDPIPRQWQTILLFPEQLNEKLEKLC